MEEVGNDGMNDKRDLSIYIMTHKAYLTPVDPLYKTVLVGAKLRTPEGTDKYLKDNTGDNISDKNGSYSELTGLYWIWKNSNESVVGLCHYRRYFCSGLFPCKYLLLKEKKLRQVMTKTDLILPRKRHYVIETVESQYIHAHHKEDLECARQQLQEIYPEYLSDFDKIMSQRSLHLFNMFIARREIMKQYCSWLFPLLFAIEKNLDVSTYNKRDKRVIGYLGERLMNVWVLHNNIQYKTLPVFCSEPQNWAKKIYWFIRRKYTKS